MTFGFWRTTAMTRELGISIHRVYGMLRDGRLAPPARDSAGDYIWTAADLERVRQAMQQPHRTRSVSAA